ncbi:MAG: hypothetical protein IJW48_00010 [Clostridia bacterium]|nr:hypothetical protein [Clostridia bacterium]
MTHYYTAKGNFKAGYQFSCTGRFGIELLSDGLNIYFVRSDVVLYVDFEGKVKEALKIQNTTENNYYWNNFVFAKSKEIGDVEYVMKNDRGLFNLFASSYDQLIVTDSIGQQVIFYDAGSNDLPYIVAGSLCAVSIVGIVAVVALYYSKAKEKHPQGTYDKKYK